MTGYLNNNRNAGLDILKIILSYSIILLHSGLYSREHLNKLYTLITIDGVCRIAVPIFFIINGYFLKIGKGNLKVWIKTQLCIYVLLTVLYYPFWINYGSFSLMINSTLRAFLFGWFHLWYINSMILGYIIICIFYQKIKLLKIIALIGFLIGCLLQYSSNYLEHFMIFQNPNLNQLLKRNVFTMALPFMLLGFIIRINNLKLSRLIFLFGWIIFILEMLINIYLKNKLNSEFGFDFYFSLIIVCPVTFLFFKDLSIPIRIKDNISSSIYFYHPLLLFIHANIAYKISSFWFASITSTCLAIVIYFSSNKNRTLSKPLK